MANLHPFLFRTSAVVKSGNYERLYISYFSVLFNRELNSAECRSALSCRSHKYFLPLSQFQWESQSHNKHGNAGKVLLDPFSHFLFRFPHFTCRCFFTFLLRVFFSISGIFPFSSAFSLSPCLSLYHPHFLREFS